MNVRRNFYCIFYQIDVNLICTIIPNLCLSNEFAGAMYRLGTHPTWPCWPANPEWAEPSEEHEELAPPPPKLDRLGLANFAAEFERRINWTSHHSRLLL